jgi:hypothetical protein
MMTHVSSIILREVTGEISGAENMNKTSLGFSTVIQLRHFQVDDIIIVTVEFYKTKIEISGSHGGE